MTTKKKESRTASPAAVEMFDRMRLELSGLTAKEEAPAPAPAQKPTIGRRKPIYLPNGQRLGRSALWS